TTLAHLLMPNSTPGPEVGSGGFLGAMGRAILETHFAAAGAYILSLSILLAGWLLCTDYFLFRVAAATTVASGRSVSALGSIGTTLKSANKKRPATDLEDGVDGVDETDEEEYEYEYEDEEAAEEEWEYEDDETEEAADEEPAAELTVRTPAYKQ